MAGTVGILECREAPTLGRHSMAVEDTIFKILTACPQPQSAPYHFVFRDSRWQTLSV